MRSVPEAEQATIGGVLLRPESFALCDGLRADEFERPDYRRLWAHICELVTAGQPIDPVSMADSQPELSRLAMQIAGATASSRNVPTYAKAVRAAASTRRMLDAGRKIATLDDDATYADAQRILADAAPRSAAATKLARDTVKRMFDGMLERMQRDSDVTGEPTGIDPLDLHCGGLHPGTVTYLAARPSMGKTLLAMQIARHVSHSKPIHAFSLEMRAVQLMERMTAAESGVDYDRIRNPKRLEDHDWPGLNSGIAALQDARISIDDGMGMDVHTLTSRARMAHMAEPLGLVVIDHLGLIERPHAKGRNDAGEIGDITREIKRLAKELVIPVLVLVQLNRGVEGRTCKKPILSDLRDSGEIEQDADDVWMLYRADYYREEGEPKDGRAELLIRKARDAAPGTIHLWADLAHMRMLAADAPPVAELQTRTRGFRRPQHRQQDAA